MFGINLPGAVITIAFFVIVTALTVMNPKVLRDYTAVFVVLLLASFAVLVFMGEKYVGWLGTAKSRS